jgi:uncharacterized membrane protein YqjE
MARPLRAVPEQRAYQEPVEPEPKQELPVIGLLKNLISETGELIRTEAQVLKLELQESSRAMMRESIKAIVYSGVALLGVLSLMAFLIIALGDAISGGSTDVRGFWISALIIGVVFTAIGGFMAMRHAKRIGHEVGLPKSQRELATDRAFVREEYQKVKEAAKP